MGTTSITISERTVASAALTTVGGEIATVLDAVRGRSDKVYTISSIAEFKRVYGDSSNLDYKYCKYLLSRGNTLKLIRTAYTGGTAASCIFSFSESSEENAPGLVATAVVSGSAYNGLKVKVINQGGAGLQNVFSLTILDAEDTVLETYPIVSLNPDSQYFYGKVVKSDSIKLSLSEGAVYSGQTLFDSHTEVQKELSGGVTVDAASCIFPFSESTDPQAYGLVVRALAVGTSYNGIKISVLNQGGTGQENVFSLTIYDTDNTVLETYPIVSLNPDSQYFYGKVVKSDVVYLSLSEGVVYVNQVLFNESTDITKTLSGGQNPSTVSDIYTPALEYFKNREISFATLILPTVSPSSAVAYAQSLISARRDFLLIIDPEEGSESYTTRSELLTEIGKLRPSVNVAEDASYIASYFPRGVMSEFADTVPPSVAIADLIATLHSRRLWFKAPAGLEYGLLTGFIDVARDLTAEEVALLQENHVNPIIIKAGTGIVAWGQDTSAISALFVRRLSVRLLTNYLKRVVYSLSQRFIFADHNEFTWNQWKNSVEPIVRDIANVNGLRNYSVVCDRTVMTEEDILNGIMRGVITIWPNSQIEKIVITFNIDNDGVSFE